MSIFTSRMNPILADFRERIEKAAEHPYWGDNWDATMDYLDFASDFPRQANDKPEHVNHARKVLTRLANFKDL